jgi:GNAT superfamily N-acetyltransferase
MTPVPPGHVAAIVTTLEVRERPLPRPMPASDLRLVRWPKPEPDKYRALFRRVGEPWLWFSRLVNDPAVEMFAVEDRAGIEVGILELDFRRPPACELAFLGLVPELAGRGHGRWLMAQALALAWRKHVELLWVHTCTLDHPSALSFYRASGFVAIRREVETFPDPRLSGHLPESAAPHVPIVR